MMAPGMLRFGNTAVPWILRFMVGWDGTEVKYYCRSKGWRVEMIPTVRSRADAVRRLQRMGVIR